MKRLVVFVVDLIAAAFARAMIEAQPAAPDVDEYPEIPPAPALAYTSATCADCGALIFEPLT